jgi:hypothetical protein
MSQWGPSRDAFSLHCGVLDQLKPLARPLLQANSQLEVFPLWFLYSPYGRRKRRRRRRRKGEEE